MVVTGQALLLVSGDTWLSPEVEVRDGNDVLVDLTGASAIYQAYQSGGPIDDAPSLEGNAVTGGVLFSSPPTLGRLRLYADPSESEDLEGVFTIEIEVQDILGRVHTPVIGDLSIIRDRVA